MVRLEGVSKRYRVHGRWILRDVDVELAGGETVAVQGANGAGKSTLLRLLAGATRPSRGHRRAASGPVGYAPDGLAPPPPLTVRAYLRHHARLRAAAGVRRATRPHDERGAAELAARLGCEALLGDRLRELSRGSLQKVVVAQAFLASPALIVLDEPFSGLDADGRLALAALIDERAAAGAAVVLTDHGDGLVAHRLWRVADGRVT
jgi:ABC-type multidrug transport system ATPase subunit